MVNDEAQNEVQLRTNDALWKMAAGSKPIQIQEHISVILLLTSARSLKR